MNRIFHYAPFTYKYTIHISIFREWEALERGDRIVKDPAKVLGDRYGVRTEYYEFKQIKPN